MIGLDDFSGSPPAGFTMIYGNERRRRMALATFSLGMTLFAMFFGLVAACDRI